MGQVHVGGTNVFGARSVDYNSPRFTYTPSDYVMVVESCKADFIKYVTDAVESFYTADASQAKDYSRIISKRQFE